MSRLDDIGRAMDTLNAREARTHMEGLFREPPSEKPIDRPKPVTPSKRHFIVVTQDHSGLGWALRLQEEGETVTLTGEPAKDDDSPKCFEQVGTQWVPRMSLKEALKTFRGPKDIWVFDDNHQASVATALQKDNVTVFGTSALAAKMEFDREYAVSVAKAAGLRIPETKEFTNAKEGLAFLDAEADRAWVLKPNDAGASYLTFVPVREQPEDANRETYNYLKHQTKLKTFVLQERVEGVELNAELWFAEGKPLDVGVLTLESKRRDNHDLGDLTGCAQDVVTMLDPQGPLVDQTIGRLTDTYTKAHYSGFADVNVILGDEGPYFLEVCNRFGYNSHVTLLQSLFKGTLGDLFDTLAHHQTKGLAKQFRHGFGVSATAFLEHPAPGLPVHVDPRWTRQWFPFDGYQEDDQLLLTGYSNEVGIFTDHGYTIEEGADNLLQKLLYNEAVSYPGITFRTDLNSSKFPNSPLRRYTALQAMRLL